MNKILTTAVLTLGTIASAYATQGEVKKIDKDAGKVTIKHEAIQNLDMPAMQMVFKAQNPALLDKVQVGDKVNFHAEKVDGTYTVTDLSAIK